MTTFAPCASVVMHWLLAMLLSVCLVASALGQEPTADYQTFKNRTGKFSVEATVADQDEKTVTSKTRDGRSVKVPKAALELEQAKKLHVDWLREQDQKQLELVTPHFSRLSQTPEAVIQLLLQIHKQFPTAPYAGLAAGTFMCLGENEFERAERIFDEAKGRIETHRKFDPSAHPQTLMSLRNNLAICWIKARRESRAAIEFAEMCEEEENVPLAVYHNATMLYEAIQRMPFFNL